MKYEELKRWLEKMPTFTSLDVVTLSGQSAESVAVALTRWVSAGRVERLRRGLYTLSANDRKVPLSPAYVASLLVEPSYLSGVWALANLSVIPEAVFTVTSATRSRRVDFENGSGRFTYQRIPERAWFGFSVKEVGGGDVLFANAEKALLDTIYWSRTVWGVERFAQERVKAGRIDVCRLRGYAKKWSAPALLKSVEAFLKFKEEKCLIW
jgi:predicted transcriptional regulator of viral defense system